MAGGSRGGVGVLELRGSGRGVSLGGCMGLEVCVREVGGGGGGGGGGCFGRKGCVCAGLAVCVVRGSEGVRARGARLCARFSVHARALCAWLCVRAHGCACARLWGVGGVRPLPGRPQCVRARPRVAVRVCVCARLARCERS